jgi:NADH:ubiquinone oxidoreductase subunit 6 (subunit J)
MLLGEASGGNPFNWVVIAPVATGFLAAIYLLPTPRRRSASVAGLAIAVALAGFSVFLFHGLGDGLPISAESILFIGFSATAIAFALLMIAQRNPARAALFFAVVVLSGCGLFLLLAAPFLMAATIIIYAGAIIVTFLFVIMLAQQRGQTDANDRSREPSLAAAVGFLILGALLVVLQRVYETSPIDQAIRQSERFSRSSELDPELKDPARAKAYLDGVVRAREKLGFGKVAIPDDVVVFETEADADAVEDLREALELTPPLFPPLPGVEQREPRVNMNEVRRATGRIYFELAYLKAVRDGRLTPTPARGEGDEGPKPLVLSKASQAWEPGLEDDPGKIGMKRLPNANIAALGRSLFTDHLIAIELGGTLLLVATIGAIAIAGGRRGEGNA